MNLIKKIKLLIDNTKVLSKDGQDITDWEKNFLEKSSKKHGGRWMCPNCESDFLMEGPCGGMSQNIRCFTCGQGYNLTPMGVQSIGVNETWISPERLRALKLNKIKDKI